MRRKLLSSAVTDFCISMTVLGVPSVHRHIPPQSGRAWLTILRSGVGRSPSTSAIISFRMFLSCPMSIVLAVIGKACPRETKPGIGQASMAAVLLGIRSGLRYEDIRCPCLPEVQECPRYGQGAP